MKPDDDRPMRYVGRRQTGAMCLNLIVSLLQLGCAIAVIAIVRRNLQLITYQRLPTGQLLVSYQCLMADPNDSADACGYAYSLGSVSIFWVFILSLMQCVTADLWGRGRLMEAVWSGIAMLWWLVGAIVLTVYTARAASTDLPGESYRIAVVVLSWVSFLLFAILLAINMYLIRVHGASLAADLARGPSADKPSWATPFGTVATQYPVVGAGTGTGTYPAAAVGTYPAAAVGTNQGLPMASREPQEPHQAYGHAGFDGAAPMPPSGPAAGAVPSNA